MSLIRRIRKKIELNLEKPIYILTVWECKTRELYPAFGIGRSRKRRHRKLFGKNCYIMILTKKEVFLSKDANYFTLPSVQFLFWEKMQPDFEKSGCWCKI